MRKVTILHTSAGAGSDRVGYIVWMCAVFFFCLSKNIVNYYLQLIFLCTVHTHKDARSTHLASDKNSFHLSAWTAGFLITTAWQAVWKKGILHITQVIINTHARKRIHMYKNTYKSKKCMNTVETLWIVLP